ncbi:MAG: hypothetical protein ACRDRX_21785 [Pseudonocardiaceae bacterium]
MLPRHGMPNLAVYIPPSELMTMVDNLREKPQSPEQRAHLTALRHPIR